MVATDDERIAEVCRQAGAQVVMTDPDCANGGWHYVNCLCSLFGQCVHRVRAGRGRDAGGDDRPRLHQWCALLSGSWEWEHGEESMGGCDQGSVTAPKLHACIWGAQQWLLDGSIQVTNVGCTLPPQAPFGARRL